MRKQCGCLLCPRVGGSFPQSPQKNKARCWKNSILAPAFSVLPAVAWKDSLKARKKPKGAPVLPTDPPAWCHQGPSPCPLSASSLLLPTTQIFQGRKLMNIYKVLAVREIKKKKHLKFMKLDPSINNRPVAGGVPPSPTEGVKFSTRSSGASQSCPSLNTCVHKHTELHCEYTVLYACRCMWCIHACIGVYTSTQSQRRTLGSLSVTLFFLLLERDGARLAVSTPKPPPLPRLCFPQHCNYSNPCPISTGVLRIRTQVLMLVQQKPLSSDPSP